MVEFPDNKRNDNRADNAITRINANGRIVIPVSIRKQLGLNSGDTLVLRVQDDLLIAESQQNRIRKVQESLRKLISADRTLSKELIAERRREAQQETEEWLG